MGSLWLDAGPDILKGKTVLLALEPSALAELLSPLLLEAGAVPKIVSTVDEALDAIQFSDPEFIILCEGFTTHHPLQNPLLLPLQKMPAHKRRNLFVTWVSAEAKTRDKLSALALSVHLVVHPDYLQSLVDLIQDTWMEYKELYRAFLQV
jgi:hypothetical protein